MPNCVNKDFVVTDFKDRSMSFPPSDSVVELPQLTRPCAGLRDQWLPFRIVCKVLDRCFEAVQPTDRLLR